VLLPPVTNGSFTDEHHEAQAAATEDGSASLTTALIVTMSCIILVALGVVAWLVHTRRSPQAGQHTVLGKWALPTHVEVSFENRLSSLGGVTVVHAPVRHSDTRTPQGTPPCSRARTATDEGSCMGSCDGATQSTHGETELARAMWGGHLGRLRSPVTRTGSGGFRRPGPRSCALPTLVDDDDLVAVDEFVHGPGAGWSIGEARSLDKLRAEHFVDELTS
jgi:hypothetical protein